MASRRQFQTLPTLCADAARLVEDLERETDRGVALLAVAFLDDVRAVYRQRGGDCQSFDRGRGGAETRGGGEEFFGEWSAAVALKLRKFLLRQRLVCFSTPSSPGRDRDNP